MSDAADGFSLDLPKGWSVFVDPSHSTPLVVSGPVGATPNAATLTAATSAFAIGAKLVAADVRGTPFASNVNVIITSAAGLDPNDIMKVVPGAKQSLASLNATGVRATRTTIGGLPAARVDYHFRPASGAVSVTGRAIYVLHGGKAYATTISVVSGKDDTDAELIARSLHIG